MFFDAIDFFLDARRELRNDALIWQLALNLYGTVSRNTEKTVHEDEELKNLLSRHSFLYQKARDVFNLFHHGVAADSFFQLRS